jgi:hypothetical protein
VCRQSHTSIFKKPGQPNTPIAKKPVQSPPSYNYDTHDINPESESPQEHTTPTHSTTHSEDSADNTTSTTTTETISSTDTTDTSTTSAYNSTNTSTTTDEKGK